MTDVLEQMKENLAKKIDEENQNRWQSVKGIMFDAAENAEELERACGSDAAMQKALEFSRLAAYLTPKERFDVAKWFAVGVLLNAPERSRDKLREAMIKHIEKLT